MTTYTPPVIEHSEWDDAPERVDLFTIERPSDTDEPIRTTYSMPGKPHAGLGLAYLRMVRKNGSVDLAASWLLEEAIGEKGYDALVAEPDLPPETMKAIFARVRDVVLGKLDNPKA